MSWQTSSLMKERPEVARFIRLLIEGNVEELRKLLAEMPALPKEPLHIGATREFASEYFIDELSHYIYSGDTALHIAAMAYCEQAIACLADHGATIDARNRRGAAPIHYAADGAPTNTTWNPEHQFATIAKLLALGANPNALDKSGVAPLHRAVRQRCTGAVRALLAGGADVNLKNKTGSTPLRLCELTTGRGGSGSFEAKREQQAIFDLLIAAGANRR
jgi:ankyrin repeat protein